MMRIFVVLFALALRSSATENATEAPTPAPTSAGVVAFDVDLTMTVSDSSQFTLENVASDLKAGIAAAIDNVETSMIEIMTIAPADGPTAAPEANATEATTPAPTAAPTQVPEENETASPTPAPEENGTATRRLASGDMTVTARFTGVPETVTKEMIESKASDIEAAINQQLNGITISGLAVVAKDTPAPTPAPFLAPTTTTDVVAGSGAFGVRLDASAAVMLLALLCRGLA